MIVFLWHYLCHRIKLENERWNNFDASTARTECLLKMKMLIFHYNCRVLILSTFFSINLAEDLLLYNKCFLCIQQESECSCSKKTIVTKWRSNVNAILNPRFFRIGNFVLFLYNMDCCYMLFKNHLPQKIAVFERLFLY